MKDCTACKNAEWKRTQSGRLHPSGEGRCKWTYKQPLLPPCFYWVGGPDTPCGGQISRNAELKEHCPYFERA